MPIKEYNLNRLLSELELSQDEFIDLCILLGCDYCDSIKGIGPKRAIELIKQHRSIEEILKHIDKKKYPVPEDWMFKEARRLFQEPEVEDPENINLKWTDPDDEGLVDFMVNKKGFAEERIRNGIKKLRKAKQGTTQGRMDSFFSVSGVTKSTTKRKAEEPKGSAKKKGKGTFKKAK